MDVMLKKKSGILELLASLFQLLVLPPFAVQLTKEVNCMANGTEAFVSHNYCYSLSGI